MKHPGIFFAAIATAMLSACTYSEINPNAALVDIRANNGYDELRDVEPGTARLILRASGSGYPAHFSVSTSPQACQNFASLGSVAYAGRGIVYPWIANAVQRGRRTKPYLVYEAKPGEPIQVSGYGSWADGTGSGYRTGNCGPMTARFIPQDGRAYTAEFVWGGKPACSLAIMDATDPDAPASVPLQAIPGCPAPSR
ncbi:hypothetical protein [Variovorax paradoxus]|uniref:hypothetical protein n=1 Tax=Variovorax paradoxus TaxID=34073 RepID=UPI0027892B89|nr:hypothetical protein [Variovorax paradoxus]MDQ0590735.1 hypothetical protein [Variovorax paradoxus]